VAIMHRGHILAEGTLEELRREHGENDLEELFFQLISRLEGEQGARSTEHGALQTPCSLLPAPCSEERP